MNYRETLARYYVECERAGISYKDAEIMRRAAMTLHRWNELECGDSNDYASWAIERDENGIPYMCRYPHMQGAKPSRQRIPDRETPALARVRAVLAKVAGATLDVNGDPRGWPLSIKLQDGRTIAPPLRY